MSRTLDVLEQREMVKRRQRATDMRVREVEITEKGREAFAAFWPVMFSRYQGMFKDIGEEEFSQLVATLHKVLRNIRLGKAGESE